MGRGPGPGETCAAAPASPAASTDGTPESPCSRGTLGKAGSSQPARRASSDISRTPSISSKNSRSFVSKHDTITQQKTCRWRAVEGSMWVDDVGVSERFPKGPWRKTTGGHLLGSLGLRVLWDALKVPKSRGYVKMKVGRNVGVRRFDASDRQPPQIY